MHLKVNAASTGHLEHGLRAAVYLACCGCSTYSHCGTGSRVAAHLFAGPACRAECTLAIQRIAMLPNSMVWHLTTVSQVA